MPLADSVDLSASATYLRLKTYDAGLVSADPCMLFKRRLLLINMDAKWEEFQRHTRAVHKKRFSTEISSHLQDEETQIVHTNILKSTGAGVIYHKLAEHLNGFGVLLLLPTSVPRTM